MIRGSRKFSTVHGQTLTWCCFIRSLMRICGKLDAGFPRCNLLYLEQDIRRSRVSNEFRWLVDIYRTHGRLFLFSSLKNSSKSIKFFLAFLILPHESNNICTSKQEIEHLAKNRTPYSRFYFVNHDNITIEF